MDTLHDRLSALADHAPRGGAPAAELWTRGTRAHRRRVAAFAAAVLVVGVVGTGIGVRIVDRGAHRSAPAPAGPVHVGLPIRYPVVERLPDLGVAPGPLTAVWVDGAAGRAPEVVGLVAGTGAFGTLGIDVSFNPDDASDVAVALSPDGRRIAYTSAGGDLLVRDLVSGESVSPLSGFGTRAGFEWSDATHLFGHVAGGSDVDGWVWAPGAAPRRVDQLTYEGDPNIRPHGVGRDVRVVIQGGGPRSCSAPTLENNTPTVANPDQWRVPQLCDVLAIVDSVLLVGHVNSERLSSAGIDPKGGNATVVAVSLTGQGITTNGPPQPRVVVAAGAPARLALAADLVGAALGAGGGAS